ncbi:hypothetical protein M427DRAFT_54597 [Gonapodya prolifera JEL478]|uniref:Uncharacterized protein n=1 Tax=Gonapodya prolifera (strain JEL478) TaxID=1344416 RepID=A0A139AKK1_GONPJ|nr:hypothetical protein M427DRAFT_54597 [Gonapodya prolifera JEL478]|eukprot:KXS17297.1 hypothetical protein M427DRAFT_54597 [Gonapodya prolifera JEL478]
MQTALDSQLIDAVEARRVDEVERLINSGASPDANKRVTLRVKVRRFFASEWMEDTVDGESALVLAIVLRDTDIVRVLLEKGAKVDGSVQWRICNYSGGRNWSIDEWKLQRWVWTLSFSGMLSLAVGGYGGEETDYNGNKWADQKPIRQLW